MQTQDIQTIEPQEPLNTAIEPQEPQEATQEPQNTLKYDSNWERELEKKIEKKLQKKLYVGRKFEKIEEESSNNNANIELNVDNGFNAFKLLALITCFVGSVITIFAFYNSRKVEND